jgi:hypothetical protein
MHSRSPSNLYRSGYVGAAAFLGILNGQGSLLHDTTALWVAV